MRKCQPVLPLLLAVAFAGAGCVHTGDAPGVSHDSAAKRPPGPVLDTGRDYADWLQWRAIAPGTEAADQFRIEQRLAASFRERDPAGAEAEATHARHQVLGEALEDHLAATTVIESSEIDTVLREQPDAFQRPRRMLLRNLFLQLPDEPQRRQQVHERIAQLRQQAVKGADFKRLAAEMSQSQSRFRQGYLGVFAPHELPPAIGTAVEGLQAGEVSEVVEGGGGLSIYYCERIDEAGKSDPDVVREKIRKTLHQHTVTRRSAQLDRELLAASGKGAAEIEASGRGFEAAAPARDLSTLRAAYALAIGLDDAAATQQALHWRARQRLARVELERRIAERLVQPEPATLRAQFEQQAADAPNLLRFHIAGIHFGETTPEAVETARAVVARIDSGGLDFATAAQSHSVDASSKRGGDLGWFDLRSLAARDWMLMRAARQVGIGENTGLLNTGSGLWLYRLLDRRQDRPATYQESEPALRAQALKQQRRELTAAIRREVLAEATAAAGGGGD